MRAFSLVLAIGSMLGFATSAIAGDYFFGCAQPGGGYIVEEGEKRLEIFYAKPGKPNEKDGKALDYKLVEQITVRDAEGYCQAENGTKYGWSLQVYLYKIEIPTGGQPIRVVFLCEVSGSGLPANVNKCKDVTTKDKRLQPTYKDFANK